MPGVRAKLGYDVADIRAVKPDIIYARGSGWGSRGPMADVGGFDAAAAWASAGMGFRMTDAAGPKPQPAAFYDLQGGNALAGAIGIALFRRERTGEGSVIDVSLMNTGLWTMAPDIVASPYLGVTKPADRLDPGNPIVNWYETADHRWITLVVLQADRYWAEFCGIIERPDLVDDPRYRDAAVRYENRRGCVAELDAVFATRPLSEWIERFERFTGVWAPFLNSEEVHAHQQVGPNGFLPSVTGLDGDQFRLVAPPMQFDEEPTTPAGPAPELGQHTEFVLLDAGLDWDEIGAARDAGALG